MQQEQPQDDFSDFAKQTAEETKKSIREFFILFRDAAFPQAKRDALDYQTVCLIEDEFRKQEDACVMVVNKSYNEFHESNEKWLERFKHSLNAYIRMAFVIAEGFIIEISGHHFTYFLDPIKIPTRLVEKYFQEANVKYNELLCKQELRAKRLSNVFRKISDKLTHNQTEIENKFSKEIKELIEVELPASHKRVEAIINQNYLQRVGAMHGLN